MNDIKQFIKNKIDNYKDVIVIGKIGKSMLFNTNKHGVIGGDTDAPIITINLALKNPDILFIIIGKSDLDKKIRKKENIPDNLISIWEYYKEYSLKNNKDFKNVDWMIKYPYELLKDFNLKKGIFFQGPQGSTNIPNFAYKITDKNTYAKSLTMFQNYVAPIYYYLNNTNLKWIMLSFDPRYTVSGRDLLNRPCKIIAAWNGKIKSKYFTDSKKQFETMKEVYEDYTWSNIIKLTTVNWKKYNVDEMINKKKYKFNIVLNYANDKISFDRYKELMKYIGNEDEFKDINIYGKWPDNLVKNDKRFKGPKKLNEIKDILEKTKYTFIIPIEKEWTTLKIFEMIQYGIIPFMHHYYDSQKNISMNVELREFLTVKNKEDLKSKINLLEKDKELHKKMLNYCLEIITEDDINFKSINDDIMKSLYSCFNEDYKYYVDNKPFNFINWNDTKNENKKENIISDWI